MTKTRNVEFDVYFDNPEPVKNIRSVIKAQRVRCFRLDKPIGQNAISDTVWSVRIGCPQ